MYGLEQGGSWCSQREWSMPYGVMWTAKGPTARFSLWGWMSLRRATSRVWERPTLIHKVCARDAAGLRQSVMMPVIVRLWMVSDTLVGGGGAYARDGVVVVEGAGPAVCVVSLLSFLGGGVYTHVFGLLFGPVCRVEGGGPVGGVMEDGVREVSPCCPCVQGGCAVPFRLYGVPLVLLAVGDEEVGGCQFVHLGGVGEVAGYCDLGGVVLTGSGVWDDVVGCPVFVGGFPCRVQFEWGVEWFWCRGFVLGFPVRRYFHFDQVSWAPGLRGGHLGGSRCHGLEECGGVGVPGGGLLARGLECRGLGMPAKWCSLLG